METYLRCMTEACQTKWSKWLSPAEFWYNTTFHYALGKSPFEVLYGFKPKHFGIRDAKEDTVMDLATWIKEGYDM